MNRIIRYGIEPDGTVISEVNGVIASPDCGELVKSPIHPYFREGDVKYSEVTWTKGFGNTHGTPVISLETRNKHRAFWGFKPLKK